MEGNKTIPRQLIEGFFRGNLAPDEEEQLLCWINEDSSHRDIFFEQQTRLREEVHETHDPTIDRKWELFSLKIAPRVSQYRKKLNIKPSIRTIVAVAAAFVAGIIVASTVWQNYGILKHEQEMRTITTPNGARSNLTLPDGTEVWLNAGTTLTYPEPFKSNRHVSLVGEAFFDVKKNGKPFVVSTPKGEVEVMGTTFNVNAFDCLTTTLVAGSVKVKSSDGSNEALLSPGQQCSVTQSGQLTIDNVDSEKFTSWKDGKLIFFREPFINVARQMERWYNVKIEMKDPHLEQLWYTGTLEMESFSEVLELLKITAPIKYKFDRKTRVLTIETTE